MTVESVVVVADSSGSAGIAGGESLAEFGGGGAGLGSGWDAFLAAVRTPGVGGGHRCGIQRDDMPAVADHGAEPVGEQAVPGDDDPAGVAMSMNSPPTGWVTVTGGQASSGGTE